MTDTNRPTTSTTHAELAKRHCKPVKSGTPALSDDEAKRLLGALPGWQRREGVISKTYPFKNYHETIAFVNAVAWVSHREDHHPDLDVGYNKCTVRYSTHSVGGLSENDFIAAAKVESLFAL